MAVIYVRISQDRFGNEYGIKRQLKECKEKAKNEGLVVTKIYSDNNKSATNRRKSRTDFERMLKDLKISPDELIVWDLDRLFRHPVDLERIIDLEITVHTVTHGELDLTSSSGRHMARHAAVYAMYEIDHKNDRIKARNRQELEAGRPVPGKRRFGYLHADPKVGRAGNTRVREDEAVFVRELFDGILQGRTIYSLAKDFTAREVPFHDKRSPWRPARIRGILSNPGYRGAVVTKNGPVESDQVEALIDPETWGRVQAILNDPTRRTSPGPRRKHLLSGIAKCGTCGSKMMHSKDGYCCKTPISGHPFIQTKVLDELVVNEIVNAFQSAPREKLASHDTDLDPEPIIEALGKLARHAEVTEESAVNGDIEERQLVKIRRMIRAKREPLEAQLEVIRAQQGAAWILANIAGSIIERGINGKYSLEVSDESRERSRSIREAFFDLDLQSKRDLIDGLLEITVDVGRIPRKRVRVHHKVAVSLNDDPVPSEEEIEVLERYEEARVNSQERNEPA